MTIVAVGAVGIVGVLGVLGLFQQTQLTPPRVSQRRITSSQHTLFTHRIALLPYYYHPLSQTLISSYYSLLHDNLSCPRQHRRSSSPSVACRDDEDPKDPLEPTNDFDSEVDLLSQQPEGIPDHFATVETDNETDKEIDNETDTTDGKDNNV